MTPRTPIRRWVSGGSITMLGALALTTGPQAAVPAAHAAATPVPATSDPYSPAYHHDYRRGAVPTIADGARMRNWSAHHAAASASSAANLSYGGGVDGIGVTTGAEQVYLVFFGSQWGTQGTGANGDVTLSGDPSGEAPYLQEMFKGLGTDGDLWSGVMTQYCDGVAAGAQSCPGSSAEHVAYPAGGALAGVWVDESSASPPQATAFQLGAEAVTAAAHFGRTTASANRDAQYVILSPPGTHPDGFNTPGGQFCAWHDWNGDPAVGVTSPYGDIAFTNSPYVTDMGTSCGAGFVNPGPAGSDDGISIVEGHEYAETITDQNPAGGWTDSSGAETGDKCAWIAPGTSGGAGGLSLATGTFAMQSTWANDGAGGAGACEFSHAVVTNAAGPA
jgi:hypothetical protein